MFCSIFSIIYIYIHKPIIKFFKFCVFIDKDSICKATGSPALSMKMVFLVSVCLIQINVA